MTSRLVLDTPLLRKCGTTLADISTAFDDADGQSKHVAAIVGQSDLERALRDFATNWDDNRKRMQKALTSLSSGVTAVADTFEDVDSQLAQPLVDAANGTTPRSISGIST